LFSHSGTVALCHQQEGAHPGTCRRTNHSGKHVLVAEVVLVAPTGSRLSSFLGQENTMYSISVIDTGNIWPTSAAQHWRSGHGVRAVANSTLLPPE